MSTVALDSLISVSLFNRGQASKIFDRLKKESQLIVLKNNKPEAIILSPKEYQRLAEIEEDYELLCEAQKRLEANGNASLFTREEVMEELGITEADIRNAGDVEIE